MPQPLSTISSMATSSLLADLAGQWRAVGGRDIWLQAAGGVDVAQRVLGGESFDVIVLAAAAMEGLAAAGRLLDGSLVPCVVSEVAIAVRRGEPKPALHSEEALREAVRGARRVGYSTGPSGVALRELLACWGIEHEMRDRLVQTRPGVAVGSLLARGEVDLGFQQLSELIGIDGIEVIGTMPPGTEILTTFSAAIGAASPQPDAARAWLAFIASPAAATTKKRHGLQPA